MGCVQAVPEDRLYIVETCGAYGRVAEPGCLCVGVPGVCVVQAAVSTRINQLLIQCETKTLDNVIVTIGVVTQYRLRRDKVYEAVYALADPVRQMQSMMFDVVRAAVPRLGLDELFEMKREIAESVKTELSEQMGNFGYEILDTLVIDIMPDAKVVAAMNLVNANRRLKLASIEKAEAEKCRIVKSAEAEAESDYLQGVGISRQRDAIISSLSSSVKEFSNETKELTQKDVTHLVLVSQYFDTLKSIAQRNSARCTFYHEDPAEQEVHTQNVRDGTLLGNDALRCFAR